MTPPNPIASIVEEKLNEFPEKFLYHCSGCTDERSEGTHQLESIEHWDESATKKFLSDAFNEIAEAGCQEERKRIREAREVLAELEHDQWIAWSKNIAETENITPARLERWKTLWVPYSTLTEAQKDQDREWADKVLNIVTPTPTGKKTNGACVMGKHDQCPRTADGYTCICPCHRSPTGEEEITS